MPFFLKMTEQQYLQSWFHSLLPFEMAEKVQAMQSWVQRELPFEMTEKDQTLHSWFMILFFFDERARMALTEEERRSVEEEKQIFYNKIGVDENSLKYVLKHGICFLLREVRASTDEERQSIDEDRDSFFKDNGNFMTALDNFILEKKQKYTSPAA